MKQITLLVDEAWLKAIQDLTNDVYDGETCKWVSVEEVAEPTCGCGDCGCGKSDGLQIERKAVSEMDGVS